jgi:CheY-like chemotaxis protein
MGGRTLDGIRVLIVDDEEDARELLAAALEQMGAAPRAVGSVDEALKAIERDRPDVVVSDIAMPGQDGYALARRLRAREAERSVPDHVAMIAVTAYATSEDERRAINAGYDQHVAKPIEASRLAASIVELVQGPLVPMADDEITLTLWPVALDHSER